METSFRGVSFLFPTFAAIKTSLFLATDLKQFPIHEIDQFHEQSAMCDQFRMGRRWLQKETNVTLFFRKYSSHSIYNSYNIHLHDTPWVLFIWKILPILVTSFGTCRLTLHIVKVFFASPLLKMWKFSCRKDEMKQHSLRLDTCGQVHSVCPNITYLSECGVLCRLSSTGSFHNLQQDKRKSAPHFLCIYYHWGLGGANLFIELCENYL